MLLVFLLIQILPYSSVPNRNRNNVDDIPDNQILPYSSVPNRNKAIFTQLTSKISIFFKELLIF